MKGPTVRQRLVRQYRDDRNARRDDAKGRRRHGPTGLFATVTVISAAEWASSPWKRNRLARPGGKKPRP